MEAQIKIDCEQSRKWGVPTWSSIDSSRHGPSGVHAKVECGLKWNNKQSWSFLGKMVVIPQRIRHVSIPWEFTRIGQEYS